MNIDLRPIWVSNDARALLSFFFRMKHPRILQGDSLEEEEILGLVGIPSCSLVREAICRHALLHYKSVGLYMPVL